ncbi:MAG TPA: hypothetical protein VK184_10020 [Nostocaceae cyanobacterium]|nr:hypothetical protein [Nostocaceae cyanobacterium]
MAKSISYHISFIESLKNPSEAAVYLEVVLEEGNPTMIKKAFLNVIEARGGVQLLSNNVQETWREFVEKIQETGEIEFSLLRILLEFLGLEIGLMVIGS